MRRFDESEAYLMRAERVIPLGSQTFSKSRTQYPFGASPFFLRRGKGSRVWDLDGNEYIDFVNGLAAITLGYGDPDVTEAVRAQLEEGVIFTCHPIEAEVAELICEMVPCAEMVRFGKNGSDATSGAVRLARAYHRKRPRRGVRIPWLAGLVHRVNRTQQGSAPSDAGLTHTFAVQRPWILREFFEARPAAFAAVVLEPMNVTPPAPGFLQGVKDLAHRHGALLVFDETITGFRYSNGGAQELFGVTPDLATFGKGLANGYPLSALAGRRDVMKLMEEIFFSFTFGGETLSLAAAKATLLKLREEPVVATLAARGEAIAQGARQIIEEAELGHIFSVSGHPSWSFLNIREWKGVSAFEIKTLFMQETIQRGILSVGTHNVSYAHTEGDVSALLGAYGEVLPMIGRVLNEGRLRESLRCEPLVPLFRVR